MDKEFKIPLYAKATLVILGLCALMALVYVAKSILLPLVFALIISILLHPIVNFLVRKRINRIVSIVIALLLTFIVIAALGTLIISQASRLSESWPVLVNKFTAMLDQTITWASGYFDIDAERIREWIAKARVDLIHASSAVLGQTLRTIGNVLFMLFLTPVYVFLILFYHPLIIEFLHRLFGKSNHDQVKEIITQTKTVIQRYLVGLIIEMVIVAAMEIIVLLSLGIEYAILLGIIGAMLNMIPYIGGLVAVALPMMVALATKSTAWSAIYVLVLYYVIQLIDNNYIVPKIVASKVKINALFSIIVVIVGNALWGIPGMFLSIPLLAIVKLLFDHIEPLKPWGFLLGDTMPSILNIKPIRIKRIRKKS
jgi:predicted PurR-regulated permease PerM